jgi:hypothetical protein
MAKGKKIRKVKIETKKPETKTSAKKIDKKMQIASVLNWASIAIFVIFGIAMLWSYLSWDSYASEIDQQTLADLEEMEVTLDDLRTALLYIAGICLVSALLIFLLKTGIEKSKVGWGWLLGWSILLVLAGFAILFTLAPGILSLIASILYATKKK